MAQVIPGRNNYCVPAAISIMLAMPVDEVCDEIRDLIGKQPISGIYFPIALRILERQGRAHRQLMPKTIARVMFDSRPSDKFYFCIFRGHVGVVHAGGYFDNSHPTGTNAIPKYKTIALYEVSNANDNS